MEKIKEIRNKRPNKKGNYKTIQEYCNDHKTVIEEEAPPEEQYFNAKKRVTSNEMRDYMGMMDALI